MRKNLLLNFSILALAFFIISAVDANAQTVTVTGSLEKSRDAAGDKIKGEIVLNLSDDLHINSNKPDSEYAIATSVRLRGEGFKVISIDYPTGKDRKFQFSEHPINVYEGKVVIPFVIEISKEGPSKALEINAVVRYQACTDEVCYPPVNKQVKLSSVVD